MCIPFNLCHTNEVPSSSLRYTIFDGRKNFVHSTFCPSGRIFSLSNVSVESIFFERCTQSCTNSICGPDVCPAGDVFWNSITFIGIEPGKLKLELHATINIFFFKEWSN